MPVSQLIIKDDEKKHIYPSGTGSNLCRPCFLPQDGGGNPHTVQSVGLQAAFRAVPVNMELNEHQLCDVGSGRCGLDIGEE